MPEEVSSTIAPAEKKYPWPEFGSEEFWKWVKEQHYRYENSNEPEGVWTEF